MSAEFLHEGASQETAPKPVLGPKDHADGIYFNLPEADYHADTAIGASGICDLLVSPLTYWTNSPHNPNREDDDGTDATTLGDYFHARMSDDFGKYALKPKGMSFATKEGKEYRARFDASVVWISDDMHRKCEAMIEAMKATGVMDRLAGGISEVSFFWTEPSGHRCKIRVDKMNGEAFDFKTMQNSMSKDLETLVAHTVANMKYSVKAFWYLRGIAKMYASINSIGPKAFKDAASEKALQVMQEFSTAEEVPPLWYIFVETSGVPNVVVRRFVSHDSTGAINAYYKFAKDAVDRATATYARYMRDVGPAKPWYPDVYWKEFADEDFVAARYILAAE